MLAWLSDRTTPLSHIVQAFNQTSLPGSATRAADCPFLVIDLEMTGLNAKQDHIVSLGWLPIRQHEVILNEARHYLVQAPVSVGQSATFHGLHDKDFDQAHDLTEVLTELLQHYAGYIFVAHHCQLDCRFLTVASQRIFGKAAKFSFIDTLNIELYRMQKQGIVMKKDALRLHQCLQRHKLPQSNQHHALADAYSCALLLLSQLKHSHADITLADLQLQSR
ncbi:exonuclease domain-containing protein [Arsukibacterium sp.]|uniref:exonuclease domain-containing protein n=1 Tax=Arsukibacterium sp. TaxID=1977258 RepID=UPI00299DDAF4|nr:exonuclease domain-containing protein [Arsukibacterium sp.]MDX1677186.1 exonuclease domain-containing protein [Arsukibacterium sp.]